MWYLICSVDVSCQDFEIFYNDETGTNEPLIHAIAINDSTIIAVGSGAIVKTNNYGNTWEPYYFDGVLNQVNFPSDSVGYAVGHSSKIMKTVDQGESWINLNTSVISSAHTAFTVSFLNNDTGFVALANGPSFAFLTTYDGGASWENGVPGSVYGRGKLQKVNDSTVYALPFGNKFYSSSDYGASWQVVLLPEGTGSSRDMFFFNKDTGIVAIREFSASCGSNFHLARTTDGGENWTTQYYDCENFGAFAFPTDLIGYASGSSYSSLGIRTMWRTIDGGLSWENLEYPVSEEHAFTGCVATAFACVDQDTCYMPTNYGTIIKMTNATGGLVSTRDENVEKPNKFKVFPNPNNGGFSINLAEIQERITRVVIHFTDGRKVYDREVLNPNEEMRISAGNMASGVYVISIFTSTNVYSGKFIKE